MRYGNSWIPQFTEGKGNPEEECDIKDQWHPEPGVQDAILSSFERRLVFVPICMLPSLDEGLPSLDEGSLDEGFRVPKL